MNTWKSQIQKYRTQQEKCQNQEALFRNQVCLIKTSFRTLYYNLVYPFLHYCATVWSSTYQSNLKRLINLQKRVIRIISRSSFDAHANLIFVSFRILKFEDINKLQICEVMHLYLNSLLRNSFNDMFLRNFAILHHKCKEIFTSFSRAQNI